MSPASTLDDLPLRHRLFMKAYPYRRASWPAPARLARPLPEARLALVTSAGFFLPGQLPFDGAARGGDCSFREIPDDAPVGDLRIGHRSRAFDHAGIEADRNLAFPLDRLHELVREGRIGGPNGRHLSFMGGITAPGRLIRDAAPAAAALLKADGVDAVLLAPV